MAQRWSHILSSMLLLKLKNIIKPCGFCKVSVNSFNLRSSINVKRRILLLAAVFDEFYAMICRIHVSFSLSCNLEMDVFDFLLDLFSLLFLDIVFLEWAEHFPVRVGVVGSLFVEDCGWSTRCSGNVNSLKEFVAGGYYWWSLGGSNLFYSHLITLFSSLLPAIGGCGIILDITGDLCSEACFSVIEFSHTLL